VPYGQAPAARVTNHLERVCLSHLERACLSDQSAVSLSWRRPSSRSCLERRIFLSPCVISRTTDLTVASLPESRSCLAVARRSSTNEPKQRYYSGASLERTPKASRGNAKAPVATTSPGPSHEHAAHFFRNLKTICELSRQRKLSRECGSPALLERRGFFVGLTDVDAGQKW